MILDGYRFNEATAFSRGIPTICVLPLHPDSRFNEATAFSRGIQQAAWGDYDLVAVLQ